MLFNKQICTFNWGLLFIILTNLYKINQYSSQVLATVIFLWTDDDFFQVCKKNLEWLTSSQGITMAVKLAQYKWPPNLSELLSTTFGRYSLCVSFQSYVKRELLRPYTLCKVNYIKAFKYFKSNINHLPRRGYRTAFSLYGWLDGKFCAFLIFSWFISW